MTKKIIIVCVALIIFISLGIYLSHTSDKAVITNDFASAPNNSDLLSNMHAAGLDVLTAEGTVMHIHEHLDIVVNGKALNVPAEIGIGSDFISPMHTHDTTGVIHIESPIKKDFKLGQFFTEWGIGLDDSHIGNYKADQNNKLVAAVNGKQVTDIANYVLKAHDEIEIWYGPKTETPNLISSYTFAAGL